MASHALIIGGTGMLSGVTEFLAQNCDTVSLICRNKNKINTHLKKINSIIIDYTDYKILSENIQSAIEKYGDIDLVVSWIHSSAPLAPFIIAEKINSYGKPFRYFDILGSAYANPSMDNSERENKFIQFKNILYRKVVLGFQIENNSSRWLTNDEISAGVINAIKNDSKENIVGLVSPWKLRP